MKLYLEHRNKYIAYRVAKQRVERILDERERLITKVQPKSPFAEHEREFMTSNPPTGGAFVNKVEEYVIEAEARRIKERLAEAKEIMNERYDLLMQVEAELRKSKDVHNVIYLLKYVDGVKADAIVQQTGYSRSQVYNILSYIDKTIVRGF